jgi:predicted acetyltransferase
LNLRIATESDLKSLTEMNILLREDEKIDNHMTYEEIQNRMEGFIKGNEYKVFLFCVDSCVVGYAVLNIEKKPIYLRQLFIERTKRSLGLGKEALQKILEKEQIDELDIEVMTWNRRAYDFYRRNGFEERYSGMRLKRG